MILRLAAVALAGLSACAKEENAPVADAAPAVEETVIAASEDAVAQCPVLDSRNWTAFTTPDGDGHALTIEGEIDLPTPGYALAWRNGIADRAFPPGLRVHLDATPPAGVVMQVVTPTPVSYTSTGASAQYRVVYVLCGGEAIAEIADVGPKA